MDEKYRQWIEAHVGENAYGNCHQFTHEMASNFPELKVVRGHYYCLAWGQRAHWWCVLPDGTNIDPTASQFPTKGKGVYVQHVEGEPEPTGKCPDCGAYCYNHEQFCSENCERSYMAYMRTGIL